MIFTVEEHFNKENDKVYAKISEDDKEVALRMMRGHHPVSVMVWWKVYYGVTDPHFCEKGVKTCAKTCEETALDRAVKPLNTTVFREKFGPSGRSLHQPQGLAQ